MVRRGDLEGAFEDVGDLLEAHAEGADLEEFAEYRDDPVRFAGEVLGVDLWSRQEEILESLLEASHVHVQGANAVGKDFASAVAALWWTFARRGLVLATAAVERQLVDVLMGEVGRLWRSAPELPGELYRSALRVPGVEHAGVVTFTSTESSKLTGYHAPRVLAVLTEAQAVPEYGWEGLQACAAGPEDRTLAVGNPLAPEGRFHRAASSGAWRSIRIPVSEHPNLDPDADRTIPGGPSEQFVERMAEDWGEGSDQFRARVEARFPESAEDALAERAWIEAAVRRGEEGEFEEDLDGELASVGVDVARFGRDRSVVAVRRGRVVTEFVEWSGEDTQAVARRVRRELERVHDEHPVGEVVVDETGVGAGVLDRLREDLELTREEVAGGLRRVRSRSATVAGFKGGSRARDPSRFADLRSQAAWALRERLEDGEIALPDDAGLRRELRALRLETTTRGKVRLESKDRTRRRLSGDSPDRFDAVCMSLLPELRGAASRELVYATG